MNLFQLFKEFGPISSKQRKMALAKITNPQDISEQDFVVDFHGLKYRGHTKFFIDRHIFYLGSYEEAILKYIGETLSKSHDRIFIDVGANVGTHSLYASKVATRVLAFEPYEVVRLQFEEHLRLNQIQNVTIFPFGLGKEKKLQRFYEPYGSNQGTGSFVKEFEEKNQDLGTFLEIQRGDDVFQELMIENVSLIKIDTEGFEVQVLRGLQKLIEEKRPPLILEYGLTTHLSFEADKELWELLLKLYDLKTFEAVNNDQSRIVEWKRTTFGTIICLPKF